MEVEASVAEGTILALVRVDILGESEYHLLMEPNEYLLFLHGDLSLDKARGIISGLWPKTSCTPQYLEGELSGFEISNGGPPLIDVLEFAPTLVLTRDLAGLEDMALELSATVGISFEEIPAERETDVVALAKAIELVVAVSLVRVIGFDDPEIIYSSSTR